jgi:hypothetical protein
MLNRRLQVLLDDDRYERLKRASEDSGVPVGEIVRRAIDRELPRPNEGRSEAIRRLLAAPLMPVPDDPDDLKAEMRALRDKTYKI